MGMDSISERLELVAVWLELHGRVGKNNELFARVCEAVAPKASSGARTGAQRSIRNWFSGHAEPARENIAVLGAAIEKIAAESGKVFNPRWLQLPLHDLAEKIGMKSAADRATETPPVTDKSSFTFDFSVPPERLERIAEKYCGAYFIYRCNSRTRFNAVVRSVLWIGPTERDLVRCRLITGGGVGTGFLIPTDDYLNAQFVFGTGGDQLLSEAMQIRRNHNSERIFVGVWLRSSSGMATGYRTILLKKPELDRTDGDPAMLRSYCRDYSAGADAHTRLAPLLTKNSLVPNTDTKRVVTMDRYEANHVLKDFDDA